MPLVLTLKMTPLETIVDNLRDGYAQLEPGTFLHSDQLMAAQVKDASLRNREFYVADGLLYSLEGEKKTPTLWITREPDNLVLRHLDEKVNGAYNNSYYRLVKTGNFRPEPEEARQAMEAKDTLRIDLTKLSLQGDSPEWRYLKISTTLYNNLLNAEERKLAERFYGEGKALGTAMKALKKAGIYSTWVYVLAPAYVDEEVKYKGLIGRASSQNLFDGVSYFNAGDCSIGIRGRLRGVRRVIAPQERMPEIS